MRQKADKLEKGEWYCDSELEFGETFLRFDRIVNRTYFFSEQKGVRSYSFDSNKEIPLAGKPPNIYISTQEDVEKYNLND